MSLLDDPLALALGTANTTNSTAVVVAAPKMGTIVPKVGTPDLNDDHAEALQILRDTLVSTQQAIANMMLISTASQHPRAFEVLNQLLTTQQETATKILELHQQRADVEKKKADTKPTIVNQTYIANAVFEGTTAELLDKIDGKDRSVIEHDDLLLSDDIDPELQS